MLRDGNDQRSKTDGLLYKTCSFEVLIFTKGYNREFVIIRFFSAPYLAATDQKIPNQIRSKIQREQ
jgi:hypothetical protein